MTKTVVNYLPVIFWMSAHNFIFYVENCFYFEIPLFHSVLVAKAFWPEIFPEMRDIGVK
jgi:hypothetical protein